MACSKYISTKETTHAARVSRLIVDPCTDLFRDILRNHVTEIQFPGILQKEKSTLIPILNKVQRDKLFPRSGNFNGTYEEFDLSLLYILLRNISGIAPHQRGWAKSPNPSDRSLSANIDRIREIRNTYCGHAVSVSLSDAEFQKLWQDLTVIISELEGSLPGGCTTYTDAAKVIKSDTMDPQQEKKFMDMIDQQHQTTEDLKGITMELKKENVKLKQDQISQNLKLDILKTEQDRQNTEQGHKRKADQLMHKKELKKLKTNQNKQRIGIKKLQHEQNKQRAELQAEQKMQRNEMKDISASLTRLEELSDSEQKNIHGNTLAVLKAHKLKKVNVRTSGVQITVEKLRDNHIAILTGKGGSGKTTTAYQVMCEFSDSSTESPYKPVLIRSPEQWDKVINPNNRFIIYLDDFIGSTNLDTGALEKWKNQLDVIFSCAKTRDVLVLMGLRRNILDEAKNSCVHTIFDDKNIVDLSSQENFTMENREEMLKAYENNCEFKASDLSGENFSNYAKKNGLDAVYRLSEYEKKAILLSDSYYGFPLTSFQFFSRRDFFQLGPSYFLHPDEKLFEAIEKMRRAKCGNISEKVKYCVLCYVFIKGSIETNNASDAFFKTICTKLRITDILEIDIKDAINDLSGLYLSRLSKENLYKFSHETILETVMVSFGQLAPDIVIKSCSRRKLHELIRTENYRVKPGEVVLKIPRRHYEDLSQRLLRGDDSDDEKLKNTNFLTFDILQHPGIEDPEFVSLFCNREMSGSLSALFHYFVKEGIIFTMIKNKSNVLMWELLERYGPHHATPVLQSSEAKLKINIKRSGKMLLDGPDNPMQVQQLSKPKFKISINDIKNIIQIFSMRKHKSEFSIILYIYKYRDLPDLRNLFHTTFCGLTVLHFCVIHGHEDLVDMILEMHTPTKTEDNWSCAHLAAYAGRSLLLQKFINLGQDITERTSEGYSVLQTALLGLRYGHQELYCPSSTVEFITSCVGTIISFPESNEFNSIIHGLLKRSTKCEIVDLMMAVDECGNNIVHYLVMHNYGDILDTLVNYDKEFVFQRNSSDLPSTLHVAVYLGKPEMVRRLWTLGVRPRDSDLSLVEICHKGERFCHRVISYSRLECNFLYDNNNYKLCWNDGDKEVLDMKLKAVEDVKVVFGSIEEFQNIRDFLLDKL